MRQRTSCYGKAIDLLSRRSHFERELERKLSQRSYDEAEIAETLDRLRTENLVDDAKTAREFIRGKLARAPIGQMKLRSDLMRRGVAREIVDEALGALVPEDDLPPTREAAARWRRRKPRTQSGPLSDRDRAALARHLAGRGFSKRAIFSVLREIQDQNPDNDHWNDDDAFDEGLS